MGKNILNLEIGDDFLDWMQKYMNCKKLASFK